jgi:hypothetical protein
MEVDSEHLGSIETRHKLPNSDYLVSDTMSIPNFDDLAPVEGMPPGCAWGVFDKDGKKDIYGTLNLITPEVIRDAAAEVRQGLSISLK